MAFQRTRIRRADDVSEFPQCRICELLFLQERIKTAGSAMMRELHAADNLRIDLVLGADLGNSRSIRAGHPEPHNKKEESSCA